MTWHHPDLYFFLGLLAVFAGLAASLAVIYECILKFRRRKPLVVLPLDGLQRDRHARPIEQRASKQPSDFSQLCESINDLPPKEQASRVREHFGIVGGARPARSAEVAPSRSSAPATMAATNKYLAQSNKSQPGKQSD